jgi:hypothetical protein
MISYDDYVTGGGSTLWTPADSTADPYTYGVDYGNTSASTSTSAVIHYKDWVNATTTTSTGWEVYRTGMTAATNAVTASTWGDLTNLKIQWSRIKPNPADRLRSMIRDRMGPAIHVKSKTMRHTTCPKEIRARETLKRVLGEDKFRSFLKRGHISVRAKSGLVYQIFPGHGMTRVYDNGQWMETLCVVLQGGFPPTDSLIMRYLLILNDERDFRKHAISHSVGRRNSSVEEVSLLPLPELFKQLKAA